ncbi:MAG: hypothetical protein DCC56_06505 [Anaerolineae bacterium]|nr:MAG: hypothetical protein DCC56_06505 [Anaerolineae bacterium]WKZ43496.1 MAG: hypothetical protein QY302_15475 [Anaerolineales bacterium]
MDYGLILTPLLFRLPLFLLWLVCIVVAVMRWKKHPRTSLATVLGCLVLSVSSFLQTILPPLFPALLEQSYEARWLVDVYFIVIRILPFVDLLGWIFVLVAIFGERKQITVSQEPTA